jgi:hypothetical protein
LTVDVEGELGQRVESDCDTDEPDELFNLKQTVRDQPFESKNRK